MLGTVHMMLSTQRLVFYSIMTLCFIASQSSARKPNDGINLDSGRSPTPLRCPPCKQIGCPGPKKASKLKCKGGFSTDICNCCPACAKVEGEDCGGEWNYLGKCDAGLYCEAQKSMNPYGPSRENDVLVGRCKKSPHHVGDEGIYCRPKCTAIFCKANPKAICSAVDVGEVKQKCQGNCQHTSCQACRFADYEPDCDKCGKDDFTCMKKYAKCIKKQYCTRNKYPCRKTAYKLKEVGKFQCMVPPCLDHY